jgi:membrane fusion protein, multidrug efflux system
MNRCGRALAAIVLLGAAAACGRGDAQHVGSAKTAPRAYRVTAMPVAARPLVYSVDAVGSIEAYQVVTVPARVEGALDRLEFDVGSKVTPETVLAVIDERHYTLLVDQAKAAVEEALASAREAEASAASSAARTARVTAELDEARANLARWSALRAKDKDFVSEEKLQSVEAAAKSLAASLDEAKAGESEAQARQRQAAAALDARRAAVAIAEKNVADTHARSPIAGVVEQRHVAAGQYVKVGDPIATLVDASSLRLRFSVSDTESVRLALGQKVRFRLKAFGARDFEAELFHVDATADDATRMVGCLASVTNPDPGLKPGFFAQVWVEVAHEGTSIVVPEGALLPTEKGFVAFVEQGGRASRRVVLLGLHTRDGQVEVLSGLAVGDRLLVNGAQSLDDGVPVEIVEESAER